MAWQILGTKSDLVNICTTDSVVDTGHAKGCPTGRAGTRPGGTTAAASAYTVS